MSDIQHMSVSLKQQSTFLIELDHLIFFLH
jgi:hypothetical protein